MNILDLITEATRAAEEWSRGKSDVEIREGVEVAARNGYIQRLRASGVSITDEADWQCWRYTFAVACFR